MNSPVRLFASVLACLFALDAGPVLAQNREILGEYRIGVVGRDNNDAIYHAVHRGAEDAVRELSERYSIDIELLIRTPATPDPAVQIEAVSQLFVEECDGIVLSPIDPGAVYPILDFVAGQGVAVALFESSIDGFDPLLDLPADEMEAGRLAGLAALRELPRTGRAAILIDRNADANMRARLDGIRSTLGYRRIHGIVECDPDYNSAVEAIAQATEADVNDLIDGWIFLDDWPLLGLPALPWEAGEGNCVAIQASPSTLMYLEDGYIGALVVHPYYEWGYSAVAALVEKLHNDKLPEEPVLILPPRTIDWRNIDDYRESWKSWMRGG